jgi:hypothetical protein
MVSGLVIRTVGKDLEKAETLFEIICGKCHRWQNPQIARRFESIWRKWQHCQIRQIANHLSKMATLPK